MLYPIYFETSSLFNICYSGKQRCLAVTVSYSPKPLALWTNRLSAETSSPPSIFSLPISSTSVPLARYPYPPCRCSYRVREFRNLRHLPTTGICWGTPDTSPCTAYPWCCQPYGPARTCWRCCRALTLMGRPVCNPTTQHSPVCSSASGQTSRRASESRSQSRHRD